MLCFFVFTLSSVLSLPTQSNPDDTLPGSEASPALCRRQGRGPQGPRRWVCSRLEHLSPGNGALGARMRLTVGVRWSQPPPPEVQALPPCSLGSSSRQQQQGAEGGGACVVRPGDHPGDLPALACPLGPVGGACWGLVLRASGVLGPCRLVHTFQSLLSPGPPGTPLTHLS